MSAGVARSQGSFERLAGRIVQIVRREIAEKFADHGETFGVVAGNEMGDAAGGVVGHRAAEFLLGDFLVGDGLDHVRARDEHVGRVARHENKIRDRRRIDRAAGAGAHNRADLRDHTAGKRIAQENFGVARERHHSLLNARAAGIVQADDGRALAQGEIHDFGDFRGVGFGERAAEDGEILREDVDQAAGDAAVAGDEAVAGRTLRFHAEIVGVVADEFVELFERAFIEQQVDAFAGAELALLVFALAALGAAAGFGFAIELAKLIEAVVVLAVGGGAHGRGSFGEGCD